MFRKPKGPNKALRDLAVACLESLAFQQFEAVRREYRNDGRAQNLFNG
jgi:hypothetical protein